MDKVLIVASKELKDGLRNRWLLAITLIFAIFSLGISFLGSAASGVIGFTSLDTTMVSLASLAIVLIPLISLLISYNTFVGEYEQGTMLLLITYPISRAQLLIGKFIGHCSILSIAALVGFGVSAFAIIVSSDIESVSVLKAFSTFILSSILLGSVFIALAFVISISVSEKSKAAGLALIAWFFFVLIYDLALLGMLVGTQGDMSKNLIKTILLLNPTDVFRMINYLHVSAASDNVISDMGGFLLTNSLTTPISGLYLILLAWITFCISVAGLLFNKKES